MDNTLRRALREFFKEFFGPFRQLATNLVGEDGEKWSTEFKKFLRREPCWIPAEKFETVRTRIGDMRNGELFLGSDDVIWMVDMYDTRIIIPLNHKQGAGVSAVHGIHENNVVYKIVGPVKITLG